MRDKVESLELSGTTTLDVSKRSLFVRNVLRNPRALTAVLILVAFGLASQLVDQFFTLRNLSNILVQTCPVGLMATGLTFVLITGGIDLSAAATMSVAAIVGALCMKAGAGALVGPIVMVGIAVAVGAFNGFAVATLGMVPFIVTLAIQVVEHGVGVWLTNAESVANLPLAFVGPFTGQIGPVPVAILVLIACAIIAHYVLASTIHGRRLYAVGINPRAANISGIPTKRVLYSAYILGGLFAGLAAIISTARLGSASAAMGSDALMMDVVSAAVIGGVSIYGGVGTILGAVIGAIFITVISNIMNLLGTTYYAALTVKGVIIVLATGLDRFNKRAR